MNYEQIEQVAAVFDTAPSITEIEVRSNGVALRLRRSTPGVGASTSKTVMSPAATPPAPPPTLSNETVGAAAVAKPANTLVSSTVEAEMAASGAVAEAGNMLVTAHMVGVFRANPAQNGKAASTVPLAVGESVSEGQALGSVETMRILNECSAPLSGVIQSVYVSDGQPVEYGQALFEIIPANRLASLTES